MLVAIFVMLGFFLQGLTTQCFQINLEVPSETIIITLSVEGEIEMLVHNSEILKRSKSTVVAITNSKNSTLAKLSDYNISYYIQRELAYENSWGKVDITSQIPAMYIIEALAKINNTKKSKSIKTTSE